MEKDYINFQSKSQRKKMTIFLIFVFIGLISLYIVLKLLIKKPENNSTEIISPLITSMSVSPTLSLIITDTIKSENNNLKTVVDTALEGTRGIYAIAIKHLKTGEMYYMNEHKVFDTGSLYKLWIMATVYKQIQNEKIKEDQILSQNVVTLNQKFSIDPEVAELKEGTVTFTVKDALTQMITISHNYAALLLTEKIRLSSVATFLKENNLTESTVGTNGGSPTATSYDIALFLEKLYRGELNSQQYTAEMIDLLKGQQLNDGLPKYLPEDSKEIAHKTGEIDLFKHDAGIVYTDHGDYIVVVMSESDFPIAAQERIAQVSKGVFDYFTQGKNN